MKKENISANITNEIISFTMQSFMKFICIEISSVWWLLSRGVHCVIELELLFRPQYYTPSWDFIFYEILPHRKVNILLSKGFCIDILLNKIIEGWLRFMNKFWTLILT